MIDCKARIIHERSNIIIIPKNLSTYVTGLKSNIVAYDLKQNCFDPSKSSPPNEFMLKLRQRMSLYESLGTNDFNLDKA
jgi:hypothetical protein